MVNREQAWEHMNNEDGGKHRSKEEQENTDERATLQESVTETEVVSSHVCLVTARNSSESHRFQVSDSMKHA